MITVNAVEVQKHRLKGPVGYTVVGSPTIVDGVVSGLDANNRIITTSSLPSNAFADCEFCVSLYIPTLSKTTSFSTLRMVRPDGTPAAAWFYISNTNILLYFGYNSSGSVGVCTIPITSNNKYAIRVVSKNGNTSFYKAQNNDSFELVSTISGYDAGTFDGRLEFGRAGDDTGAESRKIKLYLNETYIKVNGKLWFYQPADTKYIVKDGKLVWADPRLALSGPVNYEVVGSPSIVDGIASGFSSSSYLQISQTYNATNNKNVEIYVRAKMPTTFSSDFNPILTSEIAGYWGISSYTNALFTIRMGYSDSKILQFKDMYISGGIQPDTWYRFKITGNNGIWRAEIYSDSGTLLNSDDKDWTSNTVSANYTLHINCADFTGTYSGSIDLNETYIKVNDQLWFYGKNYATQNIAPVPAGYTFGTTTTPSIGYVDMRTQQFTAAPTGSTIGRDE